MVQGSHLFEKWVWQDATSRCEKSGQLKDNDIDCRQRAASPRLFSGSGSLSAFW